MRIIVTGAAGFLGWHTMARLHAVTDHELVPVTRDNWASLPDVVAKADAVIHIAGVNRGEPDAVEGANVQLGVELADAIRGANRPLRVVYANSIQAGNGTPYGNGKLGAAEHLASAVASTGGHLLDVLLPNIFGEHGRPAYNSFVATFVDAVVRGETPSIVDREVALLHAQRAAQALIDGLVTRDHRLQPQGTGTTVATVFATLQGFHELYAASGDIPVLDSPLRVDLFNTYRAALFPAHYPIALIVNADDRGRLVETVRAHGGQGQTFVSTTRPGVTRGEHFHLGKVERFVVLSGTARISLRRVFHDEVVSFDVSGEAPAVVDMPTMWVHNITNTGDTEVTTLFWTHSLFDQEHPDTYWEPVRN